MAGLSAAAGLKTLLPASSSNRRSAGLFGSWISEQDWFRPAGSHRAGEKSGVPAATPNMANWFGGCLGWPNSSASLFAEEIGGKEERRNEADVMVSSCGVLGDKMPAELAASPFDIDTWQTSEPADRLDPLSESPDPPRLSSAIRQAAGEQLPVPVSVQPAERSGSGSGEQPIAERDESSESLAMSPTFSHTFSQENPGDLHTFYELHKRLGEGAFGSVRRATCRQSGLERAVKSVGLKAVKHLANFEREISVAKSLDHPNIARLYETFRDSKHIHLVIELCTGGELFDKVVGSEGLGEAQSAIYIRQILEGVCYLHAHFLVHRDIKPENFLLQNSSPGADLKMIDFGLARTFRPGDVLSTRVGTAYYVAPQVLRGSYDEKCDIWSAGIILYILLCGYPPFFGDSDEAIFRHIKRGHFDFPSPDWDDISAEAKGMVTQLLTTNPVRRPNAEVALTSSWLKRKGAAKPAALATDFVASLKTFQAFNTLKKLSLTAVAQQLPDEETENPRKLFRSLDKNGDGMLSPQEIKEGMLQQGLQVPSEMEDLVRAVDSDGSGQLDYSEFVAATMDDSVCSKRDLCRAAFRIFDVNGDGKITHEELQRALDGSPMAKPDEPEHLYRLIGEGDANGDGCIDFEEFCAMIAPNQKQQGFGIPKVPKQNSSVLLGREGHTSVRAMASVAATSSLPLPSTQ